MQGFIYLHRKMLENPIICKDTEHIAVWVYLLLNATHKGYDVIFEGERVKLKPGQLITGRKSISAKLNINESKIQRILKTFESEQQIEQQTTPRNRLISILNWSMYQNSEQQIEQQLNNKRTTTEQQLNTNNNVNTVNKDNNNIYSVSFDELWKLYPNKKGKSATTKKAMETINKVGYEKMVQAINNYKKELKEDDWKKPMNGSTFFNGRYIDYLDENYILEEVAPLTTYKAKDSDRRL